MITHPYHPRTIPRQDADTACEEHAKNISVLALLRSKEKNDPKSHPVVGFANSVIFKMHLQFDLIIIDIIDGDLSNHWMQPWWQEKQQQMRTSPRKHGSIGLGTRPNDALGAKEKGSAAWKMTPKRRRDHLQPFDPWCEKNIHRIGIIANPSSCQCHLKVTTAWVSEFLPKRWA